MSREEILPGKESHCNVYFLPFYLSVNSFHLLVNNFQVFEQGDTNKSRPLRDEDTKKKLIDPEKLKQCTDVIGDKKWAIDNGDMFGSDVRIATKNVVDTDNGKTNRLTALAVRDIFDKKIECKDLLFMASGKEIRTKMDVWVVSPKRKDVVTPSHLFFQGTSF